MKEGRKLNKKYRLMLTFDRKRSITISIPTHLCQSSLYCLFPLPSLSLSLSLSLPHNHTHTHTHTHTLKHMHANTNTYTTSILIDKYEADRQKSRHSITYKHTDKTFEDTISGKHSLRQKYKQTNMNTTTNIQTHTHEHIITD